MKKEAEEPSCRIWDDLDKFHDLVHSTIEIRPIPREPPPQLMEVAKILSSCDNGDAVTIVMTMIRSLNNSLSEHMRGTDAVNLPVM